MSNKMFGEYVFALSCYCQFERRVLLLKVNEKPEVCNECTGAKQSHVL